MNFTVSHFFQFFRDFRHSKKFYITLTKSFFTVSIFTLLLASGISLSIYYHMLFNNSIAFSHKISDIVSEEINNFQSINTNIAKSLMQSSSLQIAMRYDIVNTDNQMTSSFHINTLLSTLKKSAPTSISGIYCITKSGSLYQSNTTSTQSRYQDISASWFQETLAGSSSTWLSPYRHSLLLPALEGHYIAYVCPYIDYISDSANGVILIEIELDSLFSSLSDTNSITYTAYRILDQKNHVIFSTLPDDSSSSRFMRNSSGYQKTLSNGWILTGIISRSSIILATLKPLGLLFLFSLFLCLLLSAVLSLKKARQISKPIYNLTDKMKIVQEENYNIQLSIPDSSDEIVSLYRNFNKMLAKAHEYIEQISREQRHLRIANFKALQAQINPHFLYNTLDTIAWSIRLNENENALSALMTLTRFFRSSLSKGEDIISLEKEFEQVTLYLQIQLFRYSDILDYDIVLDETLKDCIIPKLTLQPIVENAIYHGIKNNNRFGHIKIYCCRYDDFYDIIVEDNGNGISPERLEEINLALQQNTRISSDTGGYGLHNINERIQIYFGKEHGLSFSSMENEFTRVQIRMPYRYKKEDIT